MPDFTEEFIEDKRCHPILPGTLLLVYLLGVASFISHMESIPYFDAFYACFVTYSTIGFGDIDIYVSLKIINCEIALLLLSYFQRISYRANWFNLMIYGNGVHVIGYKLLTAWITTLLEKVTNKNTNCSDSNDFCKVEK